MIFKCTNKRCQYEAHFSDDIDFPLCPICKTPMINLNRIVENEAINTMLKNISYYGIKGTYKAIDRLIHNPIQRFKYRQILEKTIKKWNLKNYD